MSLRNIYKKLKIALCLIIVVLTFNCKSAKGIITSGVASEKLSAKQVIKAHQKSASNFNTMQARLKVEVIEGEKEQAHTLAFRMEKDKKIWLNATLNMVRMLITPKKVQFYSKLDDTYFDGDYKLLSDIVGVELNFNKVQNMLLGQAVFNLNNQPHKVEVNENTYVLSPKNQNALFELFYLINATHFKINSLQLQQQSKKRFLQVDYMAYQDVKTKIIPKNIKVVAVENTDQTTINLEFKSVSLNEKLRFPFNIPSGYKEIILN
ncbi:MAG: DUF4292 domain-containing protein [Winogradskyella sp.]